MIGRPPQKYLTEKSETSLRGKMLVLELLGTLSLRSETRPVPVSAQQKRPLGLLAILALGGRQGLSRNRIEVYLWPESSEALASHSLDQTVYAIRHALGGDFILSTGRELRLNPELVRVDVWEFDEGIGARHWAAAAGVYKGPLMEGFRFADSNELESWIDTRRARLRLDYHTAIESLANVSAEAGDNSQSVTWWRRLANSDPLSPTATKKLMLALAAAGDRAGAVKHARLYQELVRQELEIEPDSEIEDLAAALSRVAMTETPASHAREETRQDRFVSPHDNSSSALSVAVEAQRKRGGRPQRRILYAVVALVILTSSAAIWGWMRPVPSKQVVRYSLVFDSTETMVQGGAWAERLAISPDGSRLAYIGGPSRQLFIRPLNQLRATPVPGTEGAATPFFSPDGRHVGFVTHKTLQFVTLNDGPPIIVTDTLVGQAGASWGRDGMIYADCDADAGLVRVEAKPGAIPKRFTTLDTANGEIDHTQPDVLPNGKGVLFTVESRGKTAVRGATSFAVAVADIPSGKHHAIVNNAMYARYAASGHLLYVTTNGTLMIAPFDQNSMKTTGEPTVLDEGIRHGIAGSADLAVSEEGTLVYATSAGQGNQEFVWVTRDGKPQSVDPDWQGDFGHPSLSPDGRRLAVTRTPSGYPGDIWIKRLDRGSSFKLTLDGKVNYGSGWTPDGNSVTFSSESPTGVLWTKRADGSTQKVLQLHEKRSVWAPLWSPDGKWLIFVTDISAPGSGDILGIRPGIDSAPVPLVASKFSEVAPALSPNGRWLAYASDETGQFEIYVAPFPNTTAARWAVSTRGGTEPLWSHRGSELFYRDGSGNLVAVEVKTTPTFSFGRTTLLFPASGFASEKLGLQYALAPDDERFLMIRPLPDKLIVVKNWFEELDAKSRK
jgi:DNA-binding SARP family transcriptional activator/Tol biopolymer transport system component